jgi:flagellar basal body-associated protein FliL
MVPQETTDISISASSKRPPILTTITVLLVISVLVNGIQLVITFQQNQIAAQRASTYQQRVQEAEDMIAEQQTLITDLTTNYKEAAYGNPDVTRIAEQQLVATESTLVALQIIATQNTQIIQLLAYMP